METAKAKPRRRRWLQFSLRTMLLLCTAVAVSLAWFEQYVVKRHAARKRLEELHCKMTIEPAPPWAEKLLGKNYATYLDQVTSLDLSGLSDPYGETSVPRVQLNGPVLSDIGRLTSLRTLNLSHLYGITDDGLKHVVGLSNLEELRLDGAQITDDGLQHVGELSGLRRLSLFAAHGITDRGLVYLSVLTELEELDLDETDIGDEFVGALAQLPKLRRLCMDGTRITDRGIANLSGLATLEEVSLSSTDVTSDALRQLSAMQLLTELRLAHTRIGDAELERLQQLPKLRLLSLAGTAVTKDGVAKLTSLPALQELYLFGSAAQPAEISACFKQAPRAILVDCVTLGGAAATVKPASQSFQ